MMREVLQRRFGRALREEADGHGPDWPDLVLIDGGAGQLSAARGGAGRSGRERRAAGGDRQGRRTAMPGREWFHTADAPPFQLPPRDPVLYFLQRLRDEAHRFAITTHRAGRSKSLVRSELDEIAGIGAGAQAGAAEPFRLRARGEDGGVGGPGGGAGDQPGNRAAGLRAFPSRRADGGVGVAQQVALQGRALDRPRGAGAALVRTAAKQSDKKQTSK